MEFRKRKSLGLKDYDYSQANYYFITLCVNQSQNLLGNENNGIVELNAAGKMVDEFLKGLHNKFKSYELDQYIIMPNHIHFILINSGDHDSNPPLPRVIQWFKAMTSNKYLEGIKNQNWKMFERRLWQRNYYEHIIRNETELHNIRKYIVENPMALLLIKEAWKD